MKSAASTDECGCGGPLVACERCGDSRCLSCDPYDATKSGNPDSAAIRAEIGSTTPKEREERHSVAQDRFYARREWKAWAAGFATGALFVGLLWLVMS